MDHTFRKAGPADTDRINEFFIEMLNTICSVNDAQGYEQGYPDKFFTDRDDWI